MGDSFYLMSTVAAGRADEKRKTLETHSIGVGLHFVQEENPEIIGRAIERLVSPQSEPRSKEHLDAFRNHLQTGEFR